MGGIVVLVAASKSFIKEATQEVVVNKQEETVSLAVNKESPNFELNDIEGNKVKRSDFLGTPLVLIFWTTWNNSSVDQLKILDDYSSKTDSKPFKLVAINTQENFSQVSGFISRGGYTLDVLFDESGEVGEAYKVKTLPTFYFIDKEGVMKTLHIGSLSQEEMVSKAEPALK